MAIPSDLQAIFQRIDAGALLSADELNIVVAAARSQAQSVAIATGDGAVAIGGSADGAVIVTGDRNIFVSGANAEAIRILMQLRPEHETRLLNFVAGEVSSRLKQSLHYDYFISLRMEAYPAKVQRPWDVENKLGDRPPEPIPEAWGIERVFEDADNKLLILGQPGSGKTTLMLKLAEALCDRAKSQFNAPIPVLFNLSTYQQTTQPLFQWLLIELKSKYGVLKTLGEEWLSAQKLVVLLDGLDELPSNDQSACIEDINQLMASEFRLHNLLICSRQEEYDTCGQLLTLHNAVVLRELTDNQVNTYLKDISQEDFLAVLEQDNALHQLSHNPFLLTIAVLSRQALPVRASHLLRSAEERLFALLGAYVQRMLTRDIKKTSYKKRPPPTKEQTHNWLCQLADMMSQSSQTEFILERLQPSYIKSRQGLTMFFMLDIFFDLLIQRSLADYTDKLRKKLGLPDRRPAIYGALKFPVLFSNLTTDMVELIVLAVNYLRQHSTEEIRAILSSSVSSTAVTETALEEFIDEIEFDDVMTLSFSPTTVVLQSLACSGLGALLGSLANLLISADAWVSPRPLWGSVFGLLYGLCFSCFVQVRNVRYSRSTLEDKKSPGQAMRNVMSNLLTISVFRFVILLAFSGTSALLAMTMEKDVRLSLTVGLLCLILGTVKIFQFGARVG